MILHQLHLDPTTGKPALNYWAVHAETLTPVRVIGSRPPRIFLSIIEPDSYPGKTYASHPDAKFDRCAIIEDIMADIRHHLAPHTVGGSILRVEDLELPEHLLVFDGAGEHPAIFRTQFPRIIIPANPDNEEILGTPSHWIAREDLTAHGWEYYWTGCQQALEELAPAFIAANQTTA